MNSFSPENQIQIFIEDLIRVRHCKGRNGISRAYILEHMQTMKQNGLQSQNEKMSSSVNYGDSGKFCGRVGAGLVQKARDGKEEYLGRGIEKPQGWQKRRQLGAQRISHREERWAQCWSELLRLHEDSRGLRLKLILSGIP